MGSAQREREHRYIALSQVNMRRFVSLAPGRCHWQVRAGPHARTHTDTHMHECSHIKCSLTNAVHGGTINPFSFSICYISPNPFKNLVTLRSCNSALWHSHEQGGSYSNRLQ